MFWNFVENDPKRAVALAFQVGAFAGQMVNKSNMINTGPMKRKIASASGAMMDAIPSIPELARMVPFGLLGSYPVPPTREEAARGGRATARKRRNKPRRKAKR
jgi:hypothetical protein